VTPLAFIDTETTGLDPDYHQVYEIGLLLEPDPPCPALEYRWWLPVDLTTASPDALRISHYYQRRPDTPDEPADVANQLAALTAGTHLVGAVPSFDANFLTRFLHTHHHSPAWHYHLVDVEALAAGRTGHAPPWDSHQLSLALGIDPAAYDRHTALDDARWARDLYRAAIGSGLDGAPRGPVR